MLAGDNAVDRYWGSAGDTALFSHEIVPAGVPLRLHLSGQVGSMPFIVVVH